MTVQGALRGAHDCASMRVLAGQDQEIFFCMKVWLTHLRYHDYHHGDTVTIMEERVMLTEVAHDTWNTSVPVHLITKLDWARYDDKSVIWSWACLCGIKGCAQNDHIGSALWHHLAGKS